MNVPIIIFPRSIHLYDGCLGWNIESGLLTRLRM
jgi:hypothetical protein